MIFCISCASYSYCDSHNIPYNKCGKLIVATNEVELEILNNLFERGNQNNVKDLKIINKEEIKDIEPYCEVATFFIERVCIFV